MKRALPLPRLKPLSPRRRWFEKVMAAIALLNFALVLFDLSYIPLREVYRAIAPDFAEGYGRQFKGIEPHPFTESYLQNVTELEEAIATVGLFDSATEARLAELRDQSIAMIDEDPFQVANKSGDLERLKDRMRRRVEATTGVSQDTAKDALITFWSSDYLAEIGYPAEMAFFNQEIRPLIETNYFRGIGFNGKPANHFILIDGVFIVIFSAELLVRVFVLRYRYRGLKIWDAILWRWQDLLLIVPFSLFAPTWALLRMIPVTSRLKQSRLLNLEPIRQRLVSLLISGIVIELTEFVLIRIINQLQSSIRKGDLEQFLLNDRSQPSQYINLGEVNEISEIVQQLSSTVIEETLPTVRPQLEAVLTYTVTKALARSPVYRQLGNLPGFTTLTQQMVQDVVDSLYDTFYSSLSRQHPDPQREQLVDELVQQFSHTFRANLQQNNGIEKIEALALVWLEELKINYIREVATEDAEILQERSRELYEMTRVTPPS